MASSAEYLEYVLDLLADVLGYPTRQLWRLPWHSSNGSLSRSSRSM